MESTPWIKDRLSGDLAITHEKLLGLRKIFDGDGKEGLIIQGIVETLEIQGGKCRVLICFYLLQLGRSDFEIGGILRRCGRQLLVPQADSDKADSRNAKSESKRFS